MKDYPLISDYIEAIKAAEDNFEQLKHLHPVLGADGNPVISSGNFAVVFKIKVATGYVTDMLISMEHPQDSWTKEIRTE